ncbi:MAG: bifunctional DNA-formamidopyrimidine glycosylase/DNA-(apurinic or apyrimidinic site) lyase [Phycisphaeraceae bacterium]|nr:bifunctional DNA-formamidopyrimidine glycosylase/DNA-(apurinic or apyrimidinic site) lyase [Phycisphaeraceae bacterium]
MPELPEAEVIRRTLSRRVRGRKVVGVQVLRAEVIDGSATPVDLLAGQTLEPLARHGKQLVLRSTHGAGVIVRLGMTGQLRYVKGDDEVLPHTHVVWQLDDASEIQFRDPRRFGGLMPVRDAAALSEAWRGLGPDALRTRAGDLLTRLSRTSRAIKAALLDQSVLAGLGNIYVDEALFRSGLSPLRSARDLDAEEVDRLATEIRLLLRQAIAAGGSTLQDYRDAAGRQGAFQRQHRVYGRGGQPCLACHHLLFACLVAGRMTVCCPQCQPSEKALVKTSDGRR